MAVDWTVGRDDVRLVTPADPARRAGIVSSRRAIRAGVGSDSQAAAWCTRCAKGPIRLSPHCYNTRAEMALALSRLGEAE